jgi:hypothetical protein
VTPSELRLAAAALTGEARGRLLERADVVEDLLARTGIWTPWPGRWDWWGLASHFATAGHIQPRGPQ